MALEEPTAVQLRVALAGIEPAIWRCLVVPLCFTLGQLHHVIQSAFGWCDSHLHEFRIGGLSWGDPEQIGEPEFEGEARHFDEGEIRLRDFHNPGDIEFLYLYDFGDHWEHTVAFERLLALEAAPRSASCLGGARARPPEDVGGVHGYAQFLEIIANPNHPEHRDTKRWAGGYFDPEWFDLKLTDQDVRHALRTNRRMRDAPTPAKAADAASMTPPVWLSTVTGVGFPHRQSLCPRRPGVGIVAVDRLPKISANAPGIRRTGTDAVRRSVCCCEKTPRGADHRGDAAAKSGVGATVPSACITARRRFAFNRRLWLPR